MKNNFLFRWLLKPVYFDGPETEYNQSISFSLISLVYIIFLFPFFLHYTIIRQDMPLHGILLLSFAPKFASYVFSRTGYYRIGSAVFSLTMLGGIYAAIFAQPRIEVVQATSCFIPVGIFIINLYSFRSLALVISAINIVAFAWVLSLIPNLGSVVNQALIIANTAFTAILLLSRFMQNMFDKLVETKRLKSVYHSRLSSLSEMSGGIAHEVNNPLTIIQGYASQLISLVERDQVNDEKIVNAANKIIDTSERISVVIRNLRSFARDGEGEPFRAHSVNEILNGTMEFCRARFKNHAIRITTPDLPETLCVNCRPVQIIQVLLNILNNAFDAVAILDDKWVEIAVKDLGNSVEIAVTDSGKGISENISTKMFDPYFTTKDIGKGSGLGLSISASLISEHSGKLYLDQKSENTRFVMILPRAEPESVKVPAAA